VTQLKWKQREPVREPDVFSDLLQQVADIRGIDDLQEFLEPSSLSLLSPYLLDNMEKAVARIVESIDKHQKITVFMDFDCDGVCSGVMMYRYLKKFTDNVDYLIFQRSSDHGLKRKIISPDTELLIVVDAGTNDVQECLSLKQRGIDVVIIDHHPASVDNPHAIIVNNQMGDYPNRTLSGSGVVFKVLEALDEALGTLYHLEFFDLAAIGIIGDMMSLTESETRAIIHQGLEMLSNEGVKQILLKQSILDLRSVSVMTVAFSIAPIINAATRMNQSNLIVRLLISDDTEEIKNLAKECVALNKSRKEKQEVAVDGLTFDNSHKVIFCVNNDAFTDGMRGLIANSLANEHQKPTIVVKLNDASKLFEGSARGYNTVNFKDILQQSGLVESAEGHANAFGVKILKDNVDKLINYCNEILTTTEQVLYYDVELQAPTITVDEVVQAHQFNRITGKDVEPIKVKLSNLQVSERTVGKKGNMVAFIGDALKAVKFSVTENYGTDVGCLDTIDVVGTLAVNKWWHNGRKEWVVEHQIIIDDYMKTDA